MKRWLEYAQQVSELEKIAKLAPAPIVERALPALGPADAASKCLVCGKRPARACAACEGVRYCDVEHQQADARWHDAVCDALRDIAATARAVAPIGEVVADLLARIGRSTDVRASDWDGLLGAQLTPSRRRRLSDLATRPMTLASMLATMNFPARAQHAGVITVHVMAASQRELDVPLEVWAIASKMLKKPARLELALVGPELPAKPKPAEHPDVVVRTRRSLYGRALWSELGEPDLVIGYDCGLLMYPTWRSTILELRGSGVPFAITSFRAFEAAAEERLLLAAKALCVIAPTPNPWASLMGKRSSTIANDLSFDNAFVSAWG